MFEYLFSGEVVTTSQVLVTLIVAFIVYSGYKQGKFYAKFAFVTIILEILLVSGFLYFKHSTGHIAEEASEEAYYVTLAIIHGVLSLYAIGHTLFAWFAATPVYRERGNYFREHQKASIILVAAWVLSLATGVFL